MNVGEILIFTYFVLISLPWLAMAGEKIGILTVSKLAIFFFAPALFSGVLTGFFFLAIVLSGKINGFAVLLTVLFLPLSIPVMSVMNFCALLCIYVGTAKRALNLD